MKTKKCSTCGEEKPLDEYYKDKSRKDGLAGRCKLCKKQYYQENKERILEQKKQYNQENKERLAEYQKQYRQENKERIAERDKQRYQKNKERRLEQMGQYYQENKERIIEQTGRWAREKYNTDPMFRLRHNIASLIRLSLSNNGYSKNSRTYKILGCSYDEFVKHIKSQFVEGMTWENYGRYGWELDHIIPVSSAMNEEEIYLLNHYTNFQPLWVEDNRSKGGSYIEEEKQEFLENLNGH